MPAQLFFQMLKGNDPRYLLITKDYPNFIPIDLPFLYENIIKEYEEISGNNEYSAHKEDINESGRELNDINRIKAIYQLMLLGDDKMIDELREIGIEIDKIDIDSILMVKNHIELLQTNIEIYLLRHKPDNTEESEKDEFNFLKTLTRLSNLFQRHIPRNIVVTEFVTLINEAKEINKSRKHGRVNKL